MKKHWDSQLRVDVVSQTEKLLLTISLCCRISWQQTLRSFTAARLSDPLHTKPDQQQKQ